MSVNKATVKYHAESQREHVRIPGQVPQFPEGKQRMQCKTCIKGIPITWDDDNIPISFHWF